MCTAKSLFPELGKGLEVDRKSSRPIRRSAASQSGNSRGGRIIGKCKSGSEKDQGLTHEYITLYRGLFRREPTTVVKVTPERESVQHANQIQDRSSAVQPSLGDADTPG